MPVYSNGRQRGAGAPPPAPAPAASAAADPALLEAIMAKLEELADRPVAERVTVIRETAEAAGGLGDMTPESLEALAKAASKVDSEMESSENIGNNEK